MKIQTLSPNYAQSNGSAERRVHVIIQMLRKSGFEKFDLKLLLLEYKCTTIPELGSAPCELLMNKLLGAKISVNDNKLRPMI